ncbi:hypothetical protein M758_5G165500 [Ceratodon purpureus]|nr:hypothetical protein M758_5G165500 [Ceratodon purpureus]
MNTYFGQAKRHSRHSSSHDQINWTLEDLTQCPKLYWPTNSIHSQLAPQPRNRPTKPLPQNLLYKPPFSPPPDTSMKLPDNLKNPSTHVTESAEPPSLLNVPLPKTKKLEPSFQTPMSRFKKNLATSKTK